MQMWPVSRGWSSIANERKAYTERVRKSVLTPTPLIWVMMTRWGRGTSVEAEWGSWVREMTAGCWMWAVWMWVVHSWRHTIILHQSCDFTCLQEKNERFLCITSLHFFKDYFWAVTESSPKCLSFLAISYRSHYSISLPPLTVPPSYFFPIQSMT